MTATEREPVAVPVDSPEDASPADEGGAPQYSVIDERWVGEQLPERPDRAHKGVFGRVLVVAGSLEYPGAALLTGLGAARAGAGVVCLAVPESLQQWLAGRVPELIWLPLSEEARGVTGPGGWRAVAAAANDYDALVVGPGVGRHPATLRRVRRLIAEIRRPVVVDADGLNALADEREWWRTIATPAVLAPHPAEFARLAHEASLVPDDDEARIAAARDAATRWGHVLVLKGAHSVVAGPDGRVAVSAVSTPALASAGTGDVLAGAIAALLAAGLQPFEAAACGVAIHAEAGLLCEARIGRSGVLASDVAAAMPEASGRFAGGA